MPQRCRVYIGLVAACLALISASAVAAGPRPLMRVSGTCVGNTISGRALVRAPRRTLVTLRLLRRATVHSRWSPVGRARRFRSRGGTQRFRFRFTVSSLAPEAYRLRLTWSHGRVFSRAIPTSTCAPGHQVPEAPFALLLPLSLLVVGGGTLAGRRPRAR